VTRVLGLVAAGYGVYLLRAAWSGALYFYIHPIYFAPAVATGVVLLALGLLGAALGHRHHHEPLALPPWALPVLLVPLLLGFGLPPQPLSALAVGPRGVDLGSPGPEEPSPALSLAIPPERYTIKDWVKALHADPEPTRHAGKPARLTGFVHHDERLPPGWFLVARFVVRCCAVDAQPVGVPVRTEPPAIPGRGQWVNVTGTWEVAEVSGERRAVIRVTQLSPAERPAQPYLY
jgi:putative membrane protein